MTPKRINALPESNLIAVLSTTITRHTKQGGKSSVKIVYAGNDLKDYPLWLSFDSIGYAHDKAVGLCSLFGGNATTTEEALSECKKWKKVLKIRVKPDGKFFRVDGWVFAPEVIAPKVIEQQRLDGGMNEERFWGVKDRMRSKKVVTGLPVGYTDELDEVG